MAEEDYGKIIMEARKKKGWTRKQLAELYGEALRGRPITEKRIEQMEELNQYPQNLKRRYILAQILGIAPALLGLPALESSITAQIMRPGLVDLETARHRLNSYRELNHNLTAADMLEEITEFIYEIHDTLPYANTQQGKNLIFVLCDYHQFAGSILRDDQQYTRSIWHQNSAYTVAKQTQETTLRSLVLFRRGLTHHESGDLDKAVSDFQASIKLNQTDIHLKGATLMALGHVQAHAADDAMSLKAALSIMDDAEAYLERCSGIEDVSFIKFNPEGYHLNRASALLGCRSEKLRSPDQALRELSYTSTSLTRKRRYGYSMILQSKAWLTEREYSMATSLATDALGIMREINSGVNIARIAEVYQKLTTTNYKDSPAVARLGVELMKAQHPEVFA